MPLKHLRTCEPCNAIRFAGCSNVCRIPDDTDKDSWELNIQDGAGTFPEEEIA